MGDDDSEEEIETEEVDILTKLHKDALKRKKEKSASFDVNSNKKGKKRKLTDMSKDGPETKISHDIDADASVKSESKTVKSGKKKFKRMKQSSDGNEYPEETNSREIMSEKEKLVDKLSESFDSIDNDVVKEVLESSHVEGHEENEQEEAENTGLGTSQIRKEVGGFTVIGDVRKKKTDKVKV